MTFGIVENVPRYLDYEIIQTKENQMVWIVCTSGKHFFVQELFKESRLNLIYFLIL